MMSEEPPRQEILNNVNVGGHLTIGNITVNIPQQLDGNPFEPPHIRQGGLFGREENLSELHELLQSGKNVCVVAGMGGVGKTELVRQYAHCPKCRSYFTGGVFYIDARNRENIDDEIVALTKWKFKRDLLPDLKPQGKVTACWDSWKGQTENVLLILDDVVKLTDIKSCLPPEELKNLRLLLISREIPDKGIFEKLDLKTLLIPAALALLSSIIGAARVESEREQAELLCHDLGCLPLALELVGYYLDEDDYQDLSLVAMRSKLLAKVKHPSLSPEQVPMGMRALRGVQAAFDLSWDELKSEVKDLACVLGSFASAPIRWDFIAGVHSRLQIEISNPDDLKDRWLKSLRKLHLVIDVTRDIYDLHPLIRDYFGEQLKQHSKHNEIKQAFCDLFADVASNVEESINLATFNSIEPHLKKMLTWCGDSEDIQFASSLNGLALLYSSQGRYGETKPLLLRSLKIREHQLPKSDPFVLQSLNNLAELFRVQGRYIEAESSYIQILEILKSQPVLDHFFILALTLNNLAEVYRAQGQYSKAELCYKRSIEINESHLGCQHLHVATTINNLAELYRAKVRYDEAELLYVRSLKMRESQLGFDHPHVATCLNNMGELCREQGRYDEAKPLYLRALKINESQLGCDHLNVATNLNNLALLHTSQGLSDEIEPMYFRALKIKETKLGSDHPEVASSMSNLALFYQSQKRYSEAELYYLCALAIDKRCYGEEHHEIAIDLSNLAMLYEAQGRYDTAEDFQNQALIIFQKVLEDRNS
jgi:tetratricopeptide (TPR) repeat protein